MQKISNGFALAAAAVVLLTGVAGAADPPSGPLTKCPLDAVVSGTACMDKYEASVWRVPNPTTTNRALVAQIQQGTATAALLTARGAIPLGTESDDYAPCADSGQGCTDIYAVSLLFATPSTFVTWFQARQACKNAGKRLPSNAEWQAAVAGTPDLPFDNFLTDCNRESASGVVPTGSRRSCVSSDGAFDMVGNVFEWVADWMPRSATCGSWRETSATLDQQCLAGTVITGEPGALLRGGSWGGGLLAGPLSITTAEPSRANRGIGFRCVR